MSLTRMLRSLAVAGAVVMSLVGTARAQVGTATVKGRITSDGAAAAAGISVVAVNKASGFTYRTTTQEGGGYALTGLPPGNYALRITDAAGATAAEELSLAVAETAWVELALGPKGEGEKVEEIVVTGRTRRKDVKTSELGTAVSRKTIDVLPQTTNNFLSSADLAPGVVFTQDQGQGYTHIQSGAQSFDNVNVFIDGVGQKNNILRGGVSGQDSSKGNPFPQSAIAGYKVITQNYKAEYDQVSSAAITAVTQSGGNELHGRFYYDRAATDLRAKTPFEIDRERSTGRKLPYSGKNEMGASFGGPIKADVLNYFLAYDYKDINASRQVEGRNWDHYDLGSGIMPDLYGKRGSHVDPFTEHLVFGKLNWRLDDHRRAWASVKVRLEGDRVAEDSNMSAPGNYKNRSNDEVRVDVVYEMDIDKGPLVGWLAETKAGFQWYEWNPEAPGDGPMYRYKYSASNNINQSDDIILDGSSPDAQKRGQSGFTIAQDMTYSRIRGNVIKTGMKVSALNYALSGTSRKVDVINVLVDPATGLPFYENGACTGTNVSADGLNSDQCRVERALAPADVSINNAQIGLYFQDDIAVTDRLEINAGVRWDYETNPLNNSYETPADRVAALYALDVPRNGITPAPGQTYADSLAKGGVDIDEYIATGDSRRSYPWAIAPRLGFSWDVLGDRNTVLFGGVGRSYDRAMANHALDEKQKNAQSGGGEIWLMKNEMEMPYTDQVSLGVRQAVSILNFEAAVSQLHAKNQFQWFHGNRDPNGGWATQPYFDPLWGPGPVGYGGPILGDTVGENRTRMVALKVEKPYTRGSPWSAAVVYTLSDAQTKHREWNNDIFDWSYGKSDDDRPWNASTLVDKHRLVATAWTELPFGFTVVGKYSYGNGVARRMTGCPTGGCVVREGDSPGFHQIDMSLSKVFRFGPTDFTFKADVFNVFNHENFTRPTNPWAGGTPAAGQPANSVGLSDLGADRRDGVRGPPRTVKLSGVFSF